MRVGGAGLVGGAVGLVIAARWEAGEGVTVDVVGRLGSLACGWKDALKRRSGSGCLGFAGAALRREGLT